MKVYLVWKNFGISGAWYFREKKNAEKFAADLRSDDPHAVVEVSEEYASIHERIRFEDGYEPELMERPAVQFNCYMLII